jgi:hypothetical protein
MNRGCTYFIGNLSQAISLAASESPSLYSPRRVPAIYDKPVRQHKFGPYLIPHLILAPSPHFQASDTIVMPAHRRPSITRQHSHAPYKSPIIVISSDEEDDIRPVPQRSQRPRRSKSQEVLEIFDGAPTPVKHKETETQQRCRELEQAGSPHKAWVPHKNGTSLSLGA